MSCWLLVLMTSMRIVLLSAACFPLFLSFFVLLVA